MNSAKDFNKKSAELRNRMRAERWRLIDMTNEEIRGGLLWIRQEWEDTQYETNHFRRQMSALEREGSSLNEIDPDGVEIYYASRCYIEALRAWQSTIRYAHDTNRTIYFVQSEGGVIKIGTSKKLSDRPATLEKKHKTRLEILGLRAGTVGAELSIHEKFSDEAIGGEWFNPSPRLLSFIETHTKKPELKHTGRHTGVRKGDASGQAGE